MAIVADLGDFCQFQGFFVTFCLLLCCLFDFRWIDSDAFAIVFEFSGRLGAFDWVDFLGGWKDSFLFLFFKRWGGHDIRL